MTPQQKSSIAGEVLRRLERLEEHATRTEHRDARIEGAPVHIVRLLDEFCGAYLRGRFPFGDGKTDRWGRRR